MALLASSLASSLGSPLNSAATFGFSGSGAGSSGSLNDDDDENENDDDNEERGGRGGDDSDDKNETCTNGARESGVPVQDSTGQLTRTATAARATTPLLRPRPTARRPEWWGAAGKALRRLDLSRNQLDCEAVAVIAPALAQCRHIDALALSANQVGGGPWLFVFFFSVPNSSFKLDEIFL